MMLVEYTSKYRNSCDLWPLAFWSESKVSKEYQKYVLRLSNCQRGESESVIIAVSKNKIRYVLSMGEMIQFDYRVFFKWV